MPRLLAISLLLTSAIAMPACEPSQSDESPQSSASSTASAWVRDSDGVSSHTVLSSEDVDELTAVIEAAQKTAEEAREQFADSLPHERLRFAVLWMATTADGSREFVWVRPVEWSPFRIEGILLSQPRGELGGSAQAGELVSFPKEELADWVILDAERPGHAVKGATTLSAIEQRIGSPSISAED